MPDLLRPLVSSDLDACGVLTAAAEWNQTPEDWARWIALGRDLALGIECDGRVVATGGAVCYGDELAWVGMVLTLPEYRGRGFARRLLEETLRRLDARRIACVKLDATDDGRPLYAKLGFVEEGPVERWRREPAPPPTADPLPPLPWDRQLDREAFGADRGALLESLALGEAAALENGSFAMGRPGRVATFFGPCVSHSRFSADRLARALLIHHAHEPVFWDIPASNMGAVELSCRLGFRPVRHLWRMARGRQPTPVLRPQSVFGCAGFEFG